MSSAQPPKASERSVCYAARDKYYHCKATKGDEDTECKSLRGAFEAACPAAWVRHFDKRQAYEQYRKKLEEEGFKEAVGEKK